MYPPPYQQSWPPPEPCARQRDLEHLENRVTEHDRILARAKTYLQLAAMMAIVMLNLSRDQTIDLIAALLKGGAR